MTEVNFFVFGFFYNTSADVCFCLLGLRSSSLSGNDAMDIKSLINHQPRHGCTQDAHPPQDFNGWLPQALEMLRFVLVSFSTLFIKKKKK